MLQGLGEHPVIVDDTRRSIQGLREVLRPEAVRPLTNWEAFRLGRPPRVKGRHQLERLFPNRHLFIERTPGSFDPTVHAAAAPVLYTGYFQHERYFQNAAQRVAESFAPAPDEAADFQRVLPDDLPTVAVAVRAGADYQQLGWAIDQSWYRRAAELLLDTVGAARFVVTSDVPQSAQDTVAMLADLGPGITAATYPPAAQLHILAGCDHAIIAPSTFAWWAAWLGDHRTGFDSRRHVIAPKPWIQSSFDGTPSERWTRLDQEPVARMATSGHVEE